MEAIALSVDLEGFTTITQALMEHSHAGVEMLTEVINAIFTPAIRALEGRGGILCGFAGDSFTAVFPDRGFQDVLSSALIIRDTVAWHGSQQSAEGEFKLEARLGIGLGEVQWEIVQGKDQACYWFYGEGIQNAVRAQSLARANQVVSPDALCREEVADLHLKSSLEDGFCTIDSLKQLTPEMIEGRRGLPDNGFGQESVLPLSSEGEFREVLSCFINLAVPEDGQIGWILDTMHHYGGYCSHIDFTDKGWVAYVMFGAPVSYEDQTGRAVDFALAVQNKCRQNVRIGMTQGMSFAGFVGSETRAEYTGMGKTVNLAARLMLKANWGEIRFDGRIQSVMEGKISSEEVGELFYKGFSRPVATYLLLGNESLSPQPFYHNAFVGRQAELGKLISSCDPLWDGDFAGVSYIYGEAGQGKSRLAYELEQALGGRVQCYWLPSDSLHRTSLYPFASWIRQLFTDGQSGRSVAKIAEFRQRWEEFRAQIAKLPDPGSIPKELERIESILAGLIGLDWEGSLYAELEPKYRPSVTGFALRSLLEACCLIKPTVLIIEDLHLLDKESEGIITILTRRAHKLRSKLVLTSRPLDNGKLPVLPLDRDIATDTINLDGLAREQTSECIVNILKGDPDPALGDYIFSVSQGNPFVVEQLAKYLQESGQLIERNGFFFLSQTDTYLPEGVQALLTARLDRLETELKRTVQTASVLGREFAVKVLCNMLQVLENRSESLNELIVQSELHAGEQEHVWNALSQIKYIFSHSLLREAAYDMQLRKQLKQLHLLAARAILQEFSGDATKYGEIALHFDRGEEWEPAAEYYLKAGDHALGNYHSEQAKRQFDRALELYRAHYPDRHPAIAECLIRIGASFGRIGDHKSNLENKLQALDIIKAAYGEKHEKTAEAYWQVGTAYWALGDFDPALDYNLKSLALCKELLGDRHLTTAIGLISTGNVWACKGRRSLALDLFNQALEIQISILGENDLFVASTLNNLGNVTIGCGDYDKALEYLKRSAEIYQASDTSSPHDLAACYSNTAQAYYLKGEYDKSIEYYELVDRLRKESFGESHPFTLNALNHLADCYWKKGEKERALQYYQTAAEKLKQISPFGYPYLAISLGGIGRYYLENGDYPQALEYYLSALLPEDSPLGLKYFYDDDTLEGICEVYRRMGCPSEALAYSQRGLALITEGLGEDHVKNSDFLIKIGNIYLDMGDAQNAIESYRRALKLRLAEFGADNEKTQAVEKLLSDAQAQTHATPKPEQPT
jgi:tetratricopeptide (TPR) repeat protein/class 3 adenylate cyclase